MTNEDQAKTMTPEQNADLKLKYAKRINEFIEYRNSQSDSNFNYIHQERAFQIKDEIINEVYNQQQAEIDRLQAKITEFAGVILDYETKFDLIAENEAKRCIRFGITVRNECAKWAFVRVGDNSDTITYTDKMEFAMHSINGQIVYPDTSAIESMNIKQLYTNFKKP